MIQELLGSCTTGSSSSSSSAPSHSLSPSSSSVTAAAAANSSEKENLRCPRCDSPNTKFCYYNNYNLTQPRHFCKTCRRYWTKGGALRNVPIGGGCRKNRSFGGGAATAVVAAAASLGKSSGLATRFKNIPSTAEIGGTKFVDHRELPSSSVIGGGSILWTSPPQSSQLLAFLSGNCQSPNPNPNPTSFLMDNSLVPKDEGFMVGSQEGSGLSTRSNIGNLDPFSSSVSLSSLWLNNPMNQSQASIFLGEGHQNMSGFQELYHRLKSSSSANYFPEYSPVLLSNASSSTPTSAILESAPVRADDNFGFGTI